MKYNQPYGVSDPEAPYINGNPATGTMGSIPPAASIEHPQREIVNFLKDSNQTPDTNDLRQLSKSVQSGKVNYAQDGGNPNFIAITPTPAITTYQLGQRFAIRAAHPNTGPVQLNVSNISWKPVLHGDGTDLGGWEINANQIIEVAWDGNAWQMLTGSGGGLIMMTEPRDVYIDDALGNDTTYDGSSAAVDAPNGHGPWKTLRKALEMMATYNLGGWTFTIHVANGTYLTQTLLMAPTPNGSGNVVIIGNPGNPILCKMINNGEGGVLGVNGGHFTLDGLYFQSSVQGSLNYGGMEGSIWVVGFGAVWLSAVGFGPAARSQIMIGPGGNLSLGGPLYIYGQAGRMADCFMTAWSNAVVTSFSIYPDLLITGNVQYTEAFVSVSGGSQFVMPFGQISGAAGVTGQKYQVSSNGVLNCFGNGVNYLPGNVAGVQNTGGQYL